MISVLLSGYIRVYLEDELPLEIKHLLLQFFLSKNGLYLIAITHEMNANFKTKYPYEKQNQSSTYATIKLFNTKLNIMQHITLFDQNKQQVFINADPYKSFGHCLVFNINKIPSNLLCFDMNFNNMALLYRFTESNIECIAFNPSAKGNINGYLTTYTCSEMENEKRFYQMTYNYKRNSIFFIEGAERESWGMNASNNIYEYHLEDNRIDTFKDTIVYSRPVWADICSINDEYLFISGGQTQICMTDSLCPCSINSSVELFDMNACANRCVMLHHMNVQRKQHGSVYIKESNKVVVGGGDTDYRTKPIMLANKSVEVYDFVKDVWTLIPNQCEMEHSVARVFYDDNPNVISIASVGGYRPPRCEMIDLRDNLQKWEKHMICERLAMEEHVLRIVV